MAIKQIADRLGVSPSSVHGWTRDIELTPEQQRRNTHGPRGPANPEAIAARAAAWARVNRERRMAHQLEGRGRAREMDPLHMAGCMLYWAEGSKARNVVCLANSDVALVRFFCDFLRQCFGLDDGDFRLRLNFYTGNGHSIAEVEDHWLRALELPRSCLRKHTINHFPTSSSGRGRRKLPFGVCALYVNKSTGIVQHIYGAIQEYGGFDEPAWLD